MKKKKCPVCKEPILYNWKYCNKKECKKIMSPRKKKCPVRLDMMRRVLTYPHYKLPEYFRRYMHSEEHYDHLKEMIQNGVKMDMLVEIYGEEVRQWLAPLPIRIIK